MELFCRGFFSLSLALLLASCGDVRIERNTKANARDADTKESRNSSLRTKASSPDQSAQNEQKRNSLTFRIHSSLPEVTIRVNKQRQKPQSLDLFSSGEWLQRLRIGETHMEYGDSLSKYIEIGDLNFDGYKDLGFMTSHGMVNFYYDYWLYRRADNRFKRLGNYPLLDPIAEKKYLRAFLRGGAAGLLHESRVYRPEGDSLALIQREQQDFLRSDGETDLFLRTIEKRDSSRGAWRVVQKEIIAARSKGGEATLDTLRPDTLLQR